MKDEVVVHMPVKKGLKSLEEGNEDNSSVLSTSLAFQKTDNGNKSTLNTVNDHPTKQKTFFTRYSNNDKDYFINNNNLNNKAWLAQ